MAAQDSERQALALQHALEDSGWFDRRSFQEALYQWAETGIPAVEVRAWLAADVVRGDDACALRELGVSAEQVHAARLGERISKGVLPVDDAARQVLGNTDRGGIGGPGRAPRLAAQPTGADAAAQAGAGLAWWQERLRRVASLAAAIPMDLRAEMETEIRGGPDVMLVAMRDGAAGNLGGQVTTAVARQELDRLARLRFARSAGLNSVGPSLPLRVLMLGSLAIEDLNRRIAQRVETAIADPPFYLLSMLGRYPASAAAQLTWTQAAADLEAFRSDYGITDPNEALGAADQPMVLADQRDRFHALNRSLAQARIHLDRAEAQPSAGCSPIDWAAAAAEFRPDEQLTKHLRGLAQHLPASAKTATTSLPSPELTDRWRAAMAYSLAHDLGRPIERWPYTQPESASDNGRPPLRHHDPGPPVPPAPAPLLEAAAAVEELDRRVEAKVEVAIADPPAYLLSTLGSWPHHPGYSALWEVMATEIERYRLLTDTTDPTSPLGQPESPGNVWRACWQRALAQDLVQCQSTWMRYRHSVFGTGGDRAAVLRVAASARNPQLNLQPTAALLAEHQDLATATLRSQVADAASLLMYRPPNHASELHTRRSQYAKLERYAQEQQLLLDDAWTRRSWHRVAITSRARASKAAIKASIREQQRALRHVDQQLVDTGREVARLQEAQDTYLAWHAQSAPSLTQGQAAAQVLQAREEQLLEELAAYPPMYLLTELGTPPANPDGRMAWRDGARALERFRATYRIYDPDRTFADDLPAFVMAGRHPAAREQMTKARDRVREQVDDARRAITESLVRELDQDLVLLGPDDRPPGWSIEP